MTREGAERVLRRARRLGNDDRGGRRDDRGRRTPSGDDGEPEQNPMLGYRESLVRDWPGPARPDDADDAVPRRMAAHGGRGDRGRRACRPRSSTRSTATIARRSSASPPTGASSPRTCASARRSRAARASERTPQAVGASDLITYVQCPKRFYWSRVRPLPRFSGPAARIGTEIHAWIERRARGQGQLLELEDRRRPHRRGARRRPRPGRAPARGVPREPLRRGAAPLRRARVPAAARRVLGRRPHRRDLRRCPTARGRSSTGRRAAARRPTTRRSACSSTCTGSPRVEIWGKRPEDLTLTYLYLASGDEVTQADGRPGGRARTGRGVAHRDRRRRVRPDAGPLVHATATSARSATRARPGSRRTASPVQTTGRMTVVRSSLRTAGSRRPGSYPPSVTPGTSRASTPASAGTRTNDTARNHSRSPGWICTSPCVPNRRYDASSVTTGVMRYARSNSARSSSSPHSTTGFPFVHAAVPTSSGGGDSASGWSAGGGGPGR